MQWLMAPATDRHGNRFRRANSRRETVEHHRHAFVRAAMIAPEHTPRARARQRAPQRLQRIGRGEPRLQQVQRPAWTSSTSPVWDTGLEASKLLAAKPQ